MQLNKNVLICLKMVLFVVRSERKYEMEREVARRLMLRLQLWDQSQPVLDGGSRGLGGGRVLGTRNHSQSHRVWCCLYNLRARLSPIDAQDIYKRSLVI
jgi:hypothetical protein